MSAKEKQLINLTKTMNVPSFRRADAKWLKKKLSKLNSENPNFEKAMNLIDEILIEKNLIKHK